MTDEDLDPRRSLLPFTLQESMEAWFSETAPLGDGDIRTPVTLEALQRAEVKDTWVVCRRKRTREELMQMIVDLVASGHSLPSLWKQEGMPKPITIARWTKEYRPFSEALEAAEKLRGIFLAESALEILDGSTDKDQAYRDNARANLRMRMAESLNSKKYSKRVIATTDEDVVLAEKDLVSQFRALLLSHQKSFEEKMGIEVKVLTMDAEVVAQVAEDDDYDIDPLTLGMGGSIDPMGG